MPIDTICFITAVIKLTISMVIPIIAGFCVDVQLLRGSNFVGVGTFLGVLFAGFLLIMVSERISTNIKNHLDEKNDDLFGI